MGYQDSIYDAWFFRMKEKYPVMLGKLEYVETPIGWNKILENLFESLHRYEILIQKNKDWNFIEEKHLEQCLKQENVYIFIQFVQIKLKFGMLRAYYTGGCGKKNSEGIDKIIQIAEDVSKRTCIICSIAKQENMGGRCDNCKKFNNLI